MENKKSKWIEEKEAKFEKTKKEFENIKHEKGFRLIVKDIETGDIIINEAINALIGGWAKKTSVGAVGAAIVITACNTPTIVSAVDSCEKAVKQAKLSTIENTLKNPDVLEKPLSEMLLGGER